MKNETKSRKVSVPRPKLSFSVDRSEFDISSDWVQAVMGPPKAAIQKDSFLAPDINNATDAGTTTDVISDTGALSAAGENNATGLKIDTVRQDATVAELRGAVPLVSNNDPVVNIATVATSSSRIWRMRPLVRITDGLTPGQYAVYSLMLENGDTDKGAGRIYRGGYADLCRLTGLSKRGIQNVIGELQEKSVIRLHTAPGHHRLQTSSYKVPPPGAVLETWQRAGWRFAVGKSKHLIQGATVAI